MIKELLKEHGKYYFLSESVTHFRKFLKMCLDEDIQFYYYSEYEKRFNDLDLVELINEYKYLTDVIMRDKGTHALTIIMFVSFGKVQLDLTYHNGEGLNLANLFREEKLNSIL